MKIDINIDAAEEITIAYLRQTLKWWSVKRRWQTEEDEKFRKEYLAALKAIMKCLRPVK